MNSLKKLAWNEGEYSLKFPTGHSLTIASWSIRFPKWNGSPLSETTKDTYRVKPLVEVDGEPLFGELAILRLLQKDGWDGVWVDTFHGHGKKLFWNGLPDRTSPCKLPEKAEALYDKILETNGKPGGFFDIFAWLGEEFLFVEYKGQGDTIKPNQISWIFSAIKSGVPSTSLKLVEFDKRSK